MKCNKCEAELKEDVKFCPYCGAEATPEQEPVEETAPAEEVVEQTAAGEEVLEQAVSEEETAGEQEEAVPEETAERETTPIVEGKLTGGKIALLVALGVAVIAIIVALIVSGLSGNAKDPADEPTTESTGVSETTGTGETEETTEGTIPPNGNPDDATCKGSYTATDDEVVAAKDTVVATMGEEELTVGELQVYYWNQFYELMNQCNTYASYYGMDAMSFAAQYMGLDYTQPMDTQLSSDGTMTWQQQFLDSAIQSWQLQTSMTRMAQEAGWEMDAEYADSLATMAEALEESAVSYGFENALAMLEADMGKGISVEGYIDYMTKYYTSGLYYNYLCEQIEVTDAEVEAYFDEKAATYAESGIEKNAEDIYVDARHILVMPQGGTTDDEGNTTYSEEEWETCRATAQAILDEWMAGDATEATFAALANDRSEDGGSNTNGGLYENIYVGQMVEPFETWCFDPSRQYGDTGLVQTDYGYHVMYFVKSTPVWFYTAKQDATTEKQDQIMENALAACEVQVDYSAIVLNNVDFTTEEG